MGVCVPGTDHNNVERHSAPNRRFRPMRPGPTDYEDFDEWLADFFSAATRNRDVSMVAPNSYGAGYDQGFYDALRECLARRPPVTSGEGR